ncbi:MAG: hypothetical protein NUV97_03025 [archaeon]|nr:hypothetical protein [archaeon]MCR4324044.1 hypothetical protein [Nanoarchaeota archaeon]
MPFQTSSFAQSNPILFNFIAPLILITALIYAILIKIKLFSNKHTIIISVVIGLLATIGGYYSTCIQTLIVAMIISLTISLVIIIFKGSSKESTFAKIMYALISLIVILFTLSIEGSCTPWLTPPLVFKIVVGVVLLALVLYGASNQKEKKKDDDDNDDEDVYGRDVYGRNVLF